ncbi:MAG: hypothetical protein H0X14_07390 [Acidobacteria bacterium]|nr:hypothetical protein [Acidobacteriota bacterium]
MTSEQDQARALAERIARRISHNREASPTRTYDAGNNSSSVGDELAAVRAGLDQLQQRLAHIESHLTRGESASGNEKHAPRPSEQKGAKPQQTSPFSAPPAAVHSPWLSGMYVPAAHPSEERFGVEEAAVSELVDYFEREKTCNLEPGGKPCDHCAMCSSRGF